MAGPFFEETGFNLGVSPDAGPCGDITIAEGNIKDDLLYLLEIRSKLGGVWIVDQWPKAKIVDGSRTPPPVKRSEIIPPSAAAILAEAVNVRMVTAL